MKFKLRKKTGVNGTEVKISVLFSPEETDHGLCSVRDDEDVRLERLLPGGIGDDYVKADFSLMLLRSLCHYASLWSMRDNPAIAVHLLRGVEFMEARAEAAKPRRKKRRPRK
jgi:hypothetical protein